MKKLTHMNFVYTSVGIWLLAIAVSCSCKNNPNRPKKDKSHNTPTQDRSNNTNDIEKPGPAHILLTSDKNNLSRDEKAFQILLDNQTETPANLAEYKFKISLQEEGGKGSILRYKDASNQPHTKSNIEEPLSHFISQTTLKKGDKTITLPFEIHNKVGVTRITFIVAIEHIDKKDNVPPIQIVWEGLTPITDEMIREAQANNFEALAKKLARLKGVKKPVDENKFTIDMDELLDNLARVAGLTHGASYQAVKLGNIDIVRVLLERGEEFSPSSPIEDPLELAIGENKTEIAKLLIEKLDRRELNKKNMLGQTLLHIAIQNNNTEIAKLLIEKLDIGKLNQKEKLSGETPIKMAIEKGNTEVALLLIEKLDKKVLSEELDKGGILGVLCETNCRDNTTLLHLAIEKDNTKVAIALIEKLDVSKLNVGKYVEGYIKMYNPYQRSTTLSQVQGIITPVQLALKKGNIEVANALIEKLNATQLGERDVEDNTALHLAAKANYLEIVKKLLAKGLDKTKRNNAHKTPFDLTTDPAIKNLLEV